MRPNHEYRHAVRIYQDGVVVASDDLAPLFINPGVLSAADECRFFIGHQPDNDSCTASQAAPCPYTILEFRA